MSKFMIEESKESIESWKECISNLIELNKSNPVAIKKLRELEAEIHAKEDISKNKDDIVILVDTRFERRCIRISIRS